MKLYYTYIPDNFKIAIDDYIQYVSIERANRIKNLKFFEDKLRSLLGEFLLSYSLSADGSIDMNKVHLQFSYNSNGKPALKNFPSHHFNISHSGKYVVCSLSDSTVGVDIEEKKDIDIYSLLNYFHPKEKEYIISDPENSKIKFFDIWTEKESFIKFKGTGLSTPLDSFYFDSSKNLILEKDSPLDKSISIEKVFIDKNYACSVCSEKDTPLILEEITIESLLSPYAKF
ncbi:TPA: 4'-phosphopantetheinyl transferase superfamily protein [Listeria monocytogenes]|nr:4'-phosphopantetheinyl transferase superfamily protein [Listeria monocytogenes]